MEKQKILQAGKIAAQVREYAKSIIKKDIPELKRQIKEILEKENA